MVAISYLYILRPYIITTEIHTKYLAKRCLSKRTCLLHDKHIVNT